MKRLTILLTLAVLLGGCVVEPWGWGGGHGGGGGGWHEHDRGGEGRDR
jgi:hypothetical protein